MNTGKRAFRAVFFLVALAPIVVRPTPPSPERPPWHQFFVSGRVESASGGSVENYTVVLMGTVNDSWRMLHSCSPAIMESWGGSRDIIVTESSGRFFLSVWSCAKPESIAVAVVLPDTTILGSRVSRHGLEYQRYDRTYEIDGSGSFCEDEDEVTVVDGYMYTDPDLDSLTVRVR